MSKICVLAEKPSVGRDIARVLGCSQGGSGFFEGEGYIVTWALGHLVTLADPEKYGAEYQEWRMDALPILPEHLELVVIRQTMRQYQCVKKQLHRPDVAKIVIATDAGREGELVARRDQQPAPLVKRQAPLLPPQLFVALLHPDEGRRIDEHPVQGLLADPEIVIQLQQGSAHPAGS